MRQKFDRSFEVGARVIYPTHGLGIVEKIESREVCGDDCACYVIRFSGKGMTIMAPVSNASTMGIRSIISSRDVPKIMRILKNGVAEDFEPNWNKRQKNYMDRIKSGSLCEVASVYRVLFKQKQTKNLSFVEQKVFENAYQLIVSEIAEAKGVCEDKAVKMVDKALDN